MTSQVSNTWADRPDRVRRMLLRARVPPSRNRRAGRSPGDGMPAAFQFADARLYGRNRQAVVRVTQLEEEGAMSDQIRCILAESIHQLDDALSVRWRVFADEMGLLSRRSPVVARELHGYDTLDTTL